MINTAHQCGGSCFSYARGVQPELQEIFNRSTLAYERAIVDLGVAIITDINQVANQKAFIADLVSASMTMGDLLGRRRTLLLSDESADQTIDVLEATAFSRDLPFTYQQEPPPGTPVSVVPKISFDAAIQDLLSREPRLAFSAEEVAKVYDERGFAAAESASKQITEQVQQAIARVMREGGGRRVGAQEIQKKVPTILEDWSRNYSDVVYQTNVNTAYNAGTMQQSESPALRDFVLAWQYLTTGQSNVRGRQPKDVENHWAMHQFIAGKRDVVWDQGVSCPMGYR